MKNTIMKNTGPTHTYHLGIDPGWKNLGLAIVSVETATGNIARVFSKVYNPSELGGINPLLISIGQDLSKLEWFPDSITIERFVAYAGVDSAETERICMVIGALVAYSEYTYGMEPVLFRAIDWKIKLAQTLHTKTGFENPSSKLDKKFSIAAAKACLNEPSEFKTDHEADALCLAAFQHLIGK